MTRGHRRYDTGPSEDKEVGLDDIKFFWISIAIMLLSVQQCVCVCGGRGKCSESSVFAHGSLYITPNTFEDIRSHRQPLLRNHLFPAFTSHCVLNGNSVDGLNPSWETLIVHWPPCD